MLLFGARPERLEKHFRRKAQLPEQGAVQPDQVSLAKRRLAGQGIGLAELFVCAGLQLFQCRRVQPGIQPVRGHEAGDRPGKAGQPKGPRDILPRLVHFKRTQAHKGVVVFWGAVLCAHAERVHQLGYQAAGLGLAEIDVVTVPYCLVGRARPGQGMPGQVDVPGGVDRPAGTEKFQIIPIVEQILQHNRPPEGGDKRTQAALWRILAKFGESDSIVPDSARLDNKSGKSIAWRRHFAVWPTGAEGGLRKKNAAGRLTWSALQLLY